jgi:hypothetical protein
LSRQEPTWSLCRPLPHKEDPHGGEGLLRILQEGWQTVFSLAEAQDKELLQEKEEIWLGRQEAE